jgi:pimeloyl-ACP methyl ester carboxylesterase
MATFATIPNGDIVFRRTGEGDNAVVFVHGFLDDQYAWNPVLADLSAPGFESIQFDQAGFGERREPSEPINFDLFAGDLTAVVDAVDKPFVLVGHSMAAPIVELVAAARPERAQGLVLVDPIPMAGAHLPPEFMEVFGSVETYLTTRRQAAPSTPDAELDRIAAGANKRRPEFLRAAADMWNIGVPAGDQPSRFAGPVLILSGADDQFITPAVVASAVAARFDSAKSTVVEIDQSSHWPHVERPFAVAKQINQFLSRNRPVGDVDGA